MEIFRKKSLKRSNGITIMSLVITIIVLLILAGISISTLSGDNSILTKAGDSSIMTELSRIRRTSKFSIFKWINKQIW